MAEVRRRGSSVGGAPAALAAAAGARAKRPTRGRAVRPGGQAQSLVSYHLRQLREGGLVSCVRVLPTAATPTTPSSSPAVGNSCRARGPRCIRAWRSPRTQVRRVGRAGSRGCCSCARATARGPRWPRRSLPASKAGTRAGPHAGSHPKPLHPNAVRVMADRGSTSPAHRAKHLRRFARQRFDLRDQPVRPGARGVPRVPRPPRARRTGASPTPAARTTTRPTYRLRADRRRAGDAIGYLIDPP